VLEPERVAEFVNAFLQRTLEKAILVRLFAVKLRA
jgi:hypothetical protein